MLVAFFKSNVATGAVGVVGVVGVVGAALTELEIALAKADTTAWLALAASTAVAPLLIDTEA